MTVAGRAIGDHAAACSRSLDQTDPGSPLDGEPAAILLDMISGRS